MPSLPTSRRWRSFGATSTSEGFPHELAQHGERAAPHQARVSLGHREPGGRGGPAGREDAARSSPSRPARDAVRARRGPGAGSALRPVGLLGATYGGRTSRGPKGTPPDEGQQAERDVAGPVAVLSVLHEPVDVQHVGREERAAERHPRVVVGDRTHGPEPHRAAACRRGRPAPSCRGAGRSCRPAGRGRPQPGAGSTGRPAAGSPGRSTAGREAAPQAAPRGSCTAKWTRVLGTTRRSIVLQAPRG